LSLVAGQGRVTLVLQFHGIIGNLKHAIV